MSNKRTVVLGASAKRERFSNKALRMLLEAGHPVVPVHPVHRLIEGVETRASLEAVEGPVDTVTLYVNPLVSRELGPQILSLKPKRVVFNPGTENPELRASLAGQGIECVEDCTLVMLRNGSY